ncbi:MAG: ABC transporter permease [Elusimicrobia bacterium]|nr:ABC transporter permease [Elusimicrobiota bacterium]
MKNSRILRRILASRTSLAGALIIAFFALTALAAPLLAPPQNPQEPYQIPQSGYASEPAKPGPGHIFGTAEQQYDMFYGVVWGTRSAFKVGVTVTLAALLLGILAGVLAGYAGGWADEAIMRVTDVFLAFPGIVLSVVIVAMLGPGLPKVMLALAVVSWPSYARLVRGEVLSVKERDFVSAARAMGASHARILLRHILPHCLYPVIIIASLDIGAMVLVAASLSFLGLGAPPGYADWGQLIALSRNWILGSAGAPLAYWHTVVIPGAAISVFVLGWNLLGDAFRDILDPRQK